MTYTKTTWTDNVTPLSATNMNKIEQGIFDNDAAHSIDAFPAGTMVLDWANAKTINSGIMVVSDKPSDLPISAEGYLQLLCGNGGRRVVIFTCYNTSGKREIYYRDIFSSAWLNAWVKLLSPGDFATQAEVSLGTSTVTIVNPTTLRGLTTATAVASETLRASSDAVAQVSSNSVYVKKKAFTIVTSGTYRVKFDMQSSGSPTAYCRIYKNGVAYGTERSVTTSGYVTFTEDLYFSAGDTCEVWIKADTTTAYVQNFRVFFDVSYAMNFDPSVSIPPVSYEIA